MLLIQYKNIIFKKLLINKIPKKRKTWIIIQKNSIKYNYIIYKIKA